jgi:Zn-dependent protease with chaperone function
MPILVILLLAAAVLPIDWPPAVVELTPRQSLLVTAGLVAASVAASATVSWRTARSIRRDPGRSARAVNRYIRWRRFSFWLNVGITAAALFAFGWGRAVRSHVLIDWRYGPILAPFAELLVPAPYLATLAAGWLVYWPVERALHGGRSFWSPLGFWVYQARQFLVTVMLPVLLLTGQQSVSRLYPEVAAAWWYQAAMPVAAVAIAVLLPRLIRPLLGLKRLPAGPTRDRFEAAARRLGVRFTDYLLWPTRGAMANALVMGVVPWARYVIVTDRLLDGLDPDEQEAVFGHEVGHVRFGHLPYYFLFLTLSATAVAGLTLLGLEGLKRVGWELALPPPWNDLSTLPTLAATGVYVFVVFGWLSRVCERQADLFGCRAGSCGDPGCRGHDEHTRLVDRGRGLCPTGVRAMVRALEKVMVLNGWEPEVATAGRRAWWRRAGGWLKAWQHGPMSVRVNYLLTVADRPDLASAHDRKAFRVRLVLVVVLTVTTALAATFGWSELLRML